MRRPALSTLGLALLWAVAIAVGKAMLLDDGLGYRALAKPDFHPSESIQQIAWPLLLCLAAAAAVLTATSSLADRRLRVQLLVLYGVNGVMNLLWTYFLFQSQRPTWALAELPFYLGSIGGMVWISSRTSRTAVALLVPYFVWVMFMGVVLVAIIRLN